MCRSRGAITVGPVTTKIEPKMAATRQFQPKTKIPNAVISANEIATPTVQSRSTGPPLSLSSENFRVKPPSNKMMATASPTSERIIDSPSTPGK